jgi:hypothetical protein
MNQVDLAREANGAVLAEQREAIVLAKEQMKV